MIFCQENSQAQLRRATPTVRPVSTPRRRQSSACDSNDIQHRSSPRRSAVLARRRTRARAGLPSRPPHSFTITFPTRQVQVHVGTSVDLVVETTGTRNGVPGSRLSQAARSSHRRALLSARAQWQLTRANHLFEARDLARRAEGDLRASVRLAHLNVEQRARAVRRAAARLFY